MTQADAIQREGSILEGLQWSATDRTSSSRHRPKLTILLGEAMEVPLAETDLAPGRLWKSWENRLGSGG